MKKLIGVICFVFIILDFSLGQQTSDATVAHAQQTVDETDKLKTGNTKEIQNNFLQTSLNNIFGPNNSFSVNPSLFAIDSLFIKKSRNVDPATFRKQRLLRNIQLVDSISINNPDNSLSKLGFSKLSFGISIALKNNKDIRYGTFANDPQYLALNTRVMGIIKIIKNKIGQKAYYTALKDHSNVEAHNIEYEKDSIVQAILSAFWIKYDSSLLTREIKDQIDSLSPEDAILFKTDTVGNMAKILAARYAQKALWTIYPAYAYDVTNKQSSYLLTSEYTKGIRKNKEKAPWELDLKASILVGKDTTITGSNLQNQLLTISAGVNFILHRDESQASTMELKPYFQNNYQLGHVQEGGHRDSVTINVIYRIKIFDTFWIPLTISYDVNKKDHPLFGFISFALSLDSGNGSGSSKKSKS